MVRSGAQWLDAGLSLLLVVQSASAAKAALLLPSLALICSLRPLLLIRLLLFSVALG